MSLFAEIRVPKKREKKLQNIIVVYGPIFKFLFSRSKKSISIVGRRNISLDRSEYL